MSYKTISQEQLGQDTAKNSQIVTSSVKSINSGLSGGPLITSVIVTDSGYNNLDDTAAATSNSYIKILGSGFQSTANVFLNAVMLPKANITFVSPSELRAVLPVSNTGNYSLSVFNSNSAGALHSSSFVISTMPQWLTSSTLSGVVSNNAFSTTLSATSDSSITYSNTTTLPSGTTLASNGYFYGTIVSAGTYSFDVKATDQQLQDTTKTFSIESTTTVVVEYLILAGGGGAGSNWGGGGGAGGFLTGITTVSLGTKTIVVGPGGAGATTSSQNGFNGIISSFNSITALGGGGGATGIANNGANENGFPGGSGGGGSGVKGPNIGGTSTSGQGSNGGGTDVSTRSGFAGGGGGGGAGAVGGSVVTINTSGNGGIGNTSSITGTPITYAGGGGGGGYFPLSVTAGSGGSGGGGNGNATNGAAGANGTQNLGGGGGGGAGNSGNGGNGGSGVVILSFPTSFYTGTTTGSPTITTVGANTVIQFTANGSITF